MSERNKTLPYYSGDQYDGKSVDQVFKEIFESKKWQIEPGGSVSGPGSSIDQTAELITQLPIILKSLGIMTMLDIPCGDFGWMQLVELGDTFYIGADIVEQLIKTNQTLYSGKNISFQVLDLSVDQLPEVDLIFCRDCLVHLSFDDIFKCIKNVKSSRAKYFMATNFKLETANTDILTGGWRPLNLCAKPFNFIPPLFSLNEKCTEMNGSFQDKCMDLWLVADLP